MGYTCLVQNEWFEKLFFERTTFSYVSPHSDAHCTQRLHSYVPDSLGSECTISLQWGKKEAKEGEKDESY